MKRANIQNKWDFMEYFTDYCADGDTLKVVELDDGKDLPMTFEVYNQCGCLLMTYIERRNEIVYPE